MLGAEIEVASTEGAAACLPLELSVLVVIRIGMHAAYTIFRRSTGHWYES